MSLNQRLHVALGGLTVLLLTAAVTISLPAQADSPAFEAGRHYEVLSVPVRTSDPERLEVVEVFSYGCEHCFNLEPVIESWLEQVDEDVNFVRVHAAFDREWAHLASIYYTARALDVVEQVHMPVFEAIHLQRNDIFRTENVARLFNQHADVSEREFLEVFNSTGVDTRVRQADGQVRMYRARGVPTMIVEGRYRTDGNMAGSNNRMLDVVDFLLEKERAARAEQD